MNNLCGIRRRVWWLIAILPLLAWAVMLLVASANKPRIPSTGDELFDETIRLFSKLDTAPTSFTNMDTPHSSINRKTIQAVESWENRFGSDPRYWMLRYHLIDLSHMFWEGDTGEDRRDLACLKQARIRGAADSTIMIRSLSLTKYEWTGEYDRPRMPSAGVPRNEAYIHRAEGYRKDWEYIFEHHRDEYEQLVAELLECGGDRSETQYYLAQLAAEQGNYQEALEHYATGNRLNGVTRVVGFPFDEVYAMARSGQPLPDDYAFGRLAECEIAVPLPNYTKLKDVFRLLVEDAVSRNDLAALDELHTFACRMAMDANAGLIHSLVACTLLGIIQSEALTGLTLTTEQIKALNDLDYKESTALAAVRGASVRSGSYFNNQVFFSMPPQYYAEGLLSRGISISVDICLNAWLADLKAQQTGLAGPAYTAFTDVEKFSYNLLGWEP